MEMWAEILVPICVIVALVSGVVYFRAKDDDPKDKKEKNEDEKSDNRTKR